MSSPESSLLSPLFHAIGGRERIRAVATYAREAVHRRHSGGAHVEERVRVVTLRAAGGRLRIETHGLDGGRSAGGGPPDLIVLPGGDSGSLPHHGAAGDIGPAAGAQPVVLPSIDRGHGALRDASSEPRNLLAHLDERAPSVRAHGDGATEIELPAEGLLYRFDGRTGLCEWRRDERSGTVTCYLEWTIVGGIATPFLEVREALGTGATGAIDTSGTASAIGAPGASHVPGASRVPGVPDPPVPSAVTEANEGIVVTERIEVLGVAYDLPLPEALFRA